MPADSHSKVKLNVRVSPDKKDEWKNELDDGETLSSLVRRAVDKEVRDEYIAVNTLDNVEATPDIDLSEVIERLETLQGTVEALQRQIDLESIGETQAPTTEDIEELAMEIVDHVPTYSDIHPDLQRMAGGVDHTVEAYRNHIEYAQQNDPSKLPDGTVGDIAAKVREDNHTLVYQALAYLEYQTTEPIEDVTVGGQRYWILDI